MLFHKDLRFYLNICLIFSSGLLCCPLLGLLNMLEGLQEGLPTGARSWPNRQMKKRQKWDKSMTTETCAAEDTVVTPQAHLDHCS